MGNVDPLTAGVLVPPFVNYEIASVSVRGALH